MHKKDLVKPLIDNALKNFYKPGVTDMLLDMFNDMGEKNNCMGDFVFENNSDNLDFALNNYTPSQVINNLKKFNQNDAFFSFDGYGHLFSFHYQDFVDTLTDNADFVDYVVEYVDIATLNKLNQLADQDTNKILQNAYTDGVK